MGEENDQGSNHSKIKKNCSEKVKQRNRYRGLEDVKRK